MGQRCCVEQAVFLHSQTGHSVKVNLEEKRTEARLLSLRDVVESQQEEF